MNRDWHDFKALHSNIAGAREAFEDACETLFREIYKDKPVSQVRVKQGDGGIDIFVGELGVEPIIVIQCKFFLESFEESQKGQIRDSFNTALNSKNYTLKEWILCIPRVIDINEHSWWFKWKSINLNKLKKSSNFISIKNGNEIIDLLKNKNLYNKVFQIEDSIKIDEIYKAVIPRQIKTPKTNNRKLILFNNYTKYCEPFYLARKVDEYFIKSLEINNLWIFGKSGSGKTALINRNLIKHNFEYCFCDLSPINITNSKQVIEEILCNIEERFEINRTSPSENFIKSITQILCKYNKHKIIIVIDELAVTDESILKNIATDLTKLVIHYNNSTQNDGLKFIISTLSSPRDIIIDKSKASEYFQFLDCNDWGEYLNFLFDIISKALNIELDEYKIYILDACDNSPRVLKSIFRKITTLDNINLMAIETAIQQTISEVVR